VFTARYGLDLRVMYTVRLLSIIIGCAELIILAPSGGHPQ
jgi:hypothetical protein